MTNHLNQQKILTIFGAIMVVLGAGLGLWALANMPTLSQSTAQADSHTVVAGQLEPSTQHLDVRVAGTQVAGNGGMTPAPGVEAEPLSQLTVAFDAVPDSFAAAVTSAVISEATVITAGDGLAVDVRFSPEIGSGRSVYTVTFAAATRFDTIDPTISWETLQGSWAGTVPTYTAVVVLSDTLPLLEQKLGPAGPTVTGTLDIAGIEASLWQDRSAVAIVPFDQLVPRMAVLAIDGQNPVENANRFDPAGYPLVATISAELGALDLDRASLAENLLAALPSGNRNPDHLTVVAMTGVTAMCRMTAAQMDRFGPAWPAEIIGPELASADITHVSNEVPFVLDCETNTDPDNLNFCSKPEYMEALTDSGVDIIGLTGNHQNDFGRDNALLSLDIYADAGLPVYGGGRTIDEAMAPYYVTHNGNRLAFLGANSYGPKMAWATDALPGSAPFDLNIMSATIRNIKQQDRADIVLTELQYQESYDTQPLVDQRQDFNALVRAGSDIVTGVQSHVPQGIEFTDGKLILYGLGNLYFDQMWTQATREGLVVKHTIYEGQHLSTQIFTTLLYDYGQPHWTTPAERTVLLKRVFANSYW